MIIIKIKKLNKTSKLNIKKRNKLIYIYTKNK